MEKPFEYYLIHKETKKITPFISFNGVPVTSDLLGWVEVSCNIKKLKQIYDAWIDTRYKAKKRLYKYIINKLTNV